MHTNIYLPFIFASRHFFCQYWWDSEARFKQHISSNLGDSVGWSPGEKDKGEG